MPGLISALQFLTILRFKKEGLINAESLGSSWVYFPLVGAFLGLVLITLDKILFPLLPATLLSLILVFTLIILSGAMHIDGLADTLDALFSGKGKEGMLSIMREVHKGTFGVLGIIAAVLFKVALLSSIPLHLRALSLLLMTVLSRYSMGLAIAFFPYARSEGKAKVFFEQKGLKAFMLSTIITLLILALIARFVSLIILFSVVIFTSSVSLIVKRKIGGLTGDGLGALSELNELLVLLSIFVFVRTGL